MSEDQWVQAMTQRLVDLSIIAAWEPPLAGAQRCAREVLRQVKWARERCHAMEAHDEPVTLAPPGWSPP